MLDPSHCRHPLVNRFVDFPASTNKSSPNTNLKSNYGSAFPFPPLPDRLTPLASNTRRASRFRQNPSSHSAFRPPRTVSAPLAHQNHNAHLRPHISHPTLVLLPRLLRENRPRLPLLRAHARPQPHHNRHPRRPELHQGLALPATLRGARGGRAFVRAARGRAERRA